MKTQITIFAVLFFSAISLFSENSPWVNFTTNSVNTAYREGNYIWLSGSGLSKLNMITGDMESYTHANSPLPTNSPNCMTIDNNGVKWLGTSKGLVKFDGVNWQIFNTTNSLIPSDTITNIDHEKNILWMTTPAMVVKFDGANFTTYDKALDTLTLDNMTCIGIDSAGNKWMGNGYNIFRFDGTIWERFDLTNGTLPWSWVRSVFTDKNNIKYFGIKNQIVKYDGTEWKLIATPVQLFNPKSGIRSFSMDSSGNLWCATYVDGIEKYDGTKFTVFNTNTLGMIQGYSLTNSILTDENGNVYCGTSAKGLIKYDGSEWSSFPASNYLIQNPSINSIACSKANTIWVANNIGIQSINLENFFDTKSFTLSPGNEVIKSVGISPKDSVWVGSKSVTAKFDNDAFIEKSNFYSYYIEPTEINSIVFNDTIKWLGTNKGLVKDFSPQFIVFHGNGSTIASDTVLSLVFDKNGFAWAGTSRGLSTNANTMWQTYDSVNTSLISSSINALMFDASDNLWIGTNAGLCKHKGSSWTLYDESNSDIKGTKISAISKDSFGNIWITTDAGLNKFDGNTWTLYTSDNSGLPDNDLTCIMIDKNDNKWIGTRNAGLAVFNENGVKTSVDDNTIQTGSKISRDYETSSGEFTLIIGSEINENAAFEIYDQLGSLLSKQVIPQELFPGYDVNVSYLPQGMYYYSLKASSKIVSGKILIVR